jgi:hypothetical protein
MTGFFVFLCSDVARVGGRWLFFADHGRSVGAGGAGANVDRV